jgi:MFS family permease
MSSATAGAGLSSWRWALLWMCAPLLAVVFLMLMLREPPRTGVRAKNTSVREVWPELWRYRAVIVPLLLARVMVWIADGAVLVWAAPNFARNFALSPDRIGAIMGTALLASGILGPVLGGPLADVCQRSGGPRRTMTAMCVVALLSVPAALFAIMPGATLASFMLVLFLTFGFTIGTAALALATIVIPGELRGLYVAVTVTVGATFSIGVAPLVVSGLSGALGGPEMIGQSLAIVCAATSVLGAVAFGFGRRYFRQSRRPELT